MARRVAIRWQRRACRASPRLDCAGGSCPMVRYYVRVFGILILLFALVPARDAWAGPPSDQLRAGIDRVFKILGDPALDGDKKLTQRRPAIVIAAHEMFDFGERAKRSIVQYWTQRGVAERVEFVRLFTELVQRSYISKVDQ